MMYGTNKSETWKTIPEGLTGIEIGVWKGDNAANLLTRAGHLHLVDPWSVTAYKDSDEFGDYRKYLARYSHLVGSDRPEDFQRLYDAIYSGVVARFEGKAVTIHRMTSAQFFETFRERVDWVYVDGSHAYEGCLADLRGAYRITGIILGDDYCLAPVVARELPQPEQVQHGRVARVARERLVAEPLGPGEVAFVEAAQDLARGRVVGHVGVACLSEARRGRAASAHEEEGREPQTTRRAAACCGEG